MKSKNRKKKNSITTPGMNHQTKKNSSSRKKKTRGTEQTRASSSVQFGGGEDRCLQGNRKGRGNVAKESDLENRKRGGKYPTGGQLQSHLSDRKEHQKRDLTVSQKGES